MMGRRQRNMKCYLLRLGNLRHHLTSAAHEALLVPPSALTSARVYTRVPCRFSGAERKALALAKEDSRRDNTTKSYASHQDRFRVRATRLA